MAVAPPSRTRLGDLVGWRGRDECELAPHDGDQDVERAQISCGVADAALGAIRRPHVPDQSDHPDAGRSRLRCGFLGPLPVDVHDRNGTACCCECSCDRAADAAPPPPTIRLCRPLSTGPTIRT